MPSFGGRSGGRSYGCSRGSSGVTYSGRSKAVDDQIMKAAAIAPRGVQCRPLEITEKELMDVCWDALRDYRKCMDDNRVRVAPPAELNGATIVQYGKAYFSSDEYCEHIKSFWSDFCPPSEAFPKEVEESRCKWYVKWWRGSCPDA